MSGFIRKVVKSGARFQVSGLWSASGIGRQVSGVRASSLISQHPTHFITFPPLHLCMGPSSLPLTPETRHHSDATQCRPYQKCTARAEREPYPMPHLFTFARKPRSYLYFYTASSVRALRLKFYLPLNPPMPFLNLRNGNFRSTQVWFASLRFFFINNLSATPID